MNAGRRPCRHLTSVSPKACQYLVVVVVLTRINRIETQTVFSCPPFLLFVLCRISRSSWNLCSNWSWSNYYYHYYYKLLLLLLIIILGRGEKSWKWFFFSRDPCEESSGRADDGEDRRGAVRAGGAGSWLCLLYRCYHPALPKRSKVNDWETKRSSMPRTWRGSRGGNGNGRLPLE